MSILSKPPLPVAFVDRCVEVRAPPVCGALSTGRCGRPVSMSVRLSAARKLPMSCSRALWVGRPFIRSSGSSSSSSSGSGIRPIVVVPPGGMGGDEDSRPPASCNDSWVSWRSSIGPRTPVGAPLRRRLLGRELRRAYALGN